MPNQAPEACPTFGGARDVRAAKSTFDRILKVRNADLVVCGGRLRGLPNRPYRGSCNVQPDGTDPNCECHTESTPDA